MSKEEYLSHAIAWAKMKGLSILSAKAEGYEEPKSYFNKTKNEHIQPDLTCESRSGNRHYVEVAMKSNDTQKSITRWKFLSVLATMKEGNLHLLTPKGHKKHIADLVLQYKITAKIQSI
jgi:hypothetical protein